VRGLAERLTDSTVRPHSGRYVEMIRNGSAVGVVSVGRPLFGALDALPSEAALIWVKTDGLHVLPHTGVGIETQAATSADELTAIMPTGPLLILAFSYGGPLALALALRLRQVERRALTLLLLEPRSPGPPTSRRPRADESVAARARRHYDALSHSRPNRWVPYVWERAHNRIGHLVTGWRLRTGRPVSAERRWDYFVPTMIRQAQSYTPDTRQDADLYLVGGVEWLDRHRPRWRALVTTEPQTHVMPGRPTHQQIVEPSHSRVWTTLVRKLVEKQLASSDAPGHL